jgi:putative SOS response-associated peptidase YedK
MCGRYTLTRQDGIVEDLQASLGPGITASEWWKPRFNVAPTQPAPVITLHDGVRTIEMMRWGLLPFWAGREGGTKPPLMINARVESLKAKQFFRDALDRKRCLVPADGFFEWIREGKGKTAVKQPLYFHRGDKKIFAFAGLWARMRTDAGDETLSFTIITSKPNDLVRPVHDRMPIVLAEDAYATWLDPTLDGEAVRPLLGIPSDEGWVSEAVSKRVNTAANDDPSCIAPADPEPPSDDEPRQRSLF